MRSLAQESKQSPDQQLITPNTITEAKKVVPCTEAMLSLPLLEVPPE